MQPQEGAADRLQAAREAAGLSEAEIGERMGLGLAWYRDLQQDDTELTGNISLGHLNRI
ncbi:MAG: hypothetical protein ACR2HK_11040 [Gemmatimonadales bacterium]